MPLADDLRPTSFDTMVGQPHLIGPDGLLRVMATNKMARSLIMYGPPGTGKSTTALIMAKELGKPFHALNAVNATVKEIRDIADKAPATGAVLYLDEIQYFNQKQQQSLLPYIESGVITLIAATTENPYHNVYNAVLSRCLVIEFKPVTAEDIATLLNRYSNDDSNPLFGLNRTVCDKAAQLASGDVRRAINDLDVLIATKPASDITVEDLINTKPSANMAGFDRAGDSHYSYISALQKSIRGSDPDAAVFWLAKLLEGGDIISPCRRLLAICCEDIGLASPEAITHTFSCVQAAQQLGLPEAYKPLTQAVLYLALAPKSASNEPAWMAAQDDIRNGHGARVPVHLRETHAPGYVWPQDHPFHWTPQQYLPDDLIGTVYYQPGDNPIEQGLYRYWEYVRSHHPKNGAS